MPKIICKRCGKEKYWPRSNSKYCRRCQILISQQNKRDERIKKHKCVDCGIKVKPIIIYKIR